MSEGYQLQVARQVKSVGSWTLIEQITWLVTVTERRKGGFGKLLLTSADGVKLFIKEMVACAFISLLQSCPLIRFIHLSFCLPGFHVEKKPRTHTHTDKNSYHTQRPWRLTQPSGLVSIVSAHMHKHSAHTPRLTNLAHSPNQNIGVIQTTPLMP